MDSSRAALELRSPEHMLFKNPVSMLASESVEGIVASTRDSLDRLVLVFIASRKTSKINRTLLAGKFPRPALRPQKVPTAGRMLNAIRRLVEVVNGA